MKGEIKMEASKMRTRDLLRYLKKLSGGKYWDLDLRSIESFGYGYHLNTAMATLSVEAEDSGVFYWKYVISVAAPTKKLARKMLLDALGRNWDAIIKSVR